MSQTTGPSTPTDAEPDEGEIIESRELGTIQLGRRIGQGGMGRVYEACRPNLPDAMFAVKFLEPSLLRNAEALERFESEARSLAELRHRNIVRVLGYGRTQWGPCILMELLRGRPLSKFLKGLAGNPLDRGLACSVIVEVLEGLQRVHEKGLVHRDIKGENIFLETGDGDVVVKLIDFGIVKEKVGSVSPSENTGASFVGTPSAAAPEQLLGRTIGTWTDIYQVGVLAYLLLAGRHPFEEAARAGFAAIARAQVLEDAPPLSSFAPDLPAEIVSAVMTMLQKEPSRRVLAGRDGRPDGSAKAFRAPFRNLVREIERQQLVQDGQQSTAHNRLLELVQRSTEVPWPPPSQPQVPMTETPSGSPPVGGTAPLRTMTRMGDVPAAFAQAQPAAVAMAQHATPASTAPAPEAPAMSTSYSSTTAPTASTRPPSAALAPRPSRAPVIAAAIALPLCLVIGSVSVWLLTRRHTEPASTSSAASATATLAASPASTIEAMPPVAVPPSTTAATAPASSPTSGAPEPPALLGTATAVVSASAPPAQAPTTTASSAPGRTKAPPGKPAPAGSASDPALWGLGVFK